MAERKAVKTSFITILPTTIELDEAWNCRQEYERTDGEANDPSEALTDGQLEQSIAQHGILEAPAVMLVGESYKAVWGFRRIRAAQKVKPKRKITCRLLREGPHLARAFNLIENVHRRALKPWEVAEALVAMKHENPILRDIDLANMVNLASARS